MPTRTLHRSQRSYRELPPIVSGYPLDNVRVSFYAPASAVNLVTNPSIERNTTNWTAAGSASIARSATRQRYGAYALEVTPTTATTDGAYYGGSTPLALSSGSLYFASVFGYFAAGVPYKMYFANTSGTQVGTAYEFRGRGRWERVWVSYNETTTTNRRVYITKNGHASTRDFYLDGLQVEAVQLTSYLDGDQLGLVIGQQAYYWTGTPHGSTSVRVSATRSGGVEVKLSDYGFVALAFIGMGLTGYDNLSTPNAYVGGEIFERTVYTSRVFDIAGVVSEDSFPLLQILRSDLGEVLSPRTGILTQPLILRFQTLDDCGRERGEPVEIACTLEPNSLAGNWNNNNAEAISLTFKTYLPYVGAGEGEAGAELSYQSISELAVMAYRDTAGIWNAIEGIGATVNVILPLPDGRLLVGGSFTNAGGDANADKLALYDFTTDTWTALNATPLNNTVFALGLLPDQNTVLVGGAFTNAGGAADADYLCYLNLTTGAYSAINATPLDNIVRAVEVLPNGNALIGGSFTNAGGANGDLVTQLVGTVYTPLNATPLAGAGPVYAIHVLPNGNALIGGIFDNAGGDANADDVVIWNATTGAFVAPNTSPTSTGAAYTIEVGPDGKAYIGRISTTSATNNIQSWAGPSLPYLLLGEGLSSGTNVYKILALPDGTLVISGDFTVSGPITFPVRLAGWNGSSFFLQDFIFSGDVYALAYTQDGKLVVASDTAGTGPYAAITTLTNDGTADAYPVFELVGPGTVHQIKNYTTGDVLYFDLVLNDGERAALTLGPGRLAFTSNFRGNIRNTILPGSSEATFRLASGANSISVLIAGTTDADTAVSAHWRVPYQSADDALYR